MSSPTLPYPFSFQPPPGPWPTMPPLLISPDYPDTALEPGYVPGAYMPYGAAPSSVPLPARVRTLSDAQQVGRWVVWRDQKAGKQPPVVQTWPAQRSVVSTLQAVKKEAQTDASRAAVTRLAYEYWTNVQGGGKKKTPADAPQAPMPAPAATTFLTALLQGAGAVPAQAAPSAVPYQEPGVRPGAPRWVVPAVVGGGLLLVLALVLSARGRRR